MAEDDDEYLESAGVSAPEDSNPMTAEMIPEITSTLSKVGFGLNYAYTKLVARSRKLTDISILVNFVHLRYVDIGDNEIEDISPLSALTFLLALKVDKNLLQKCLRKEMRFLQIADFSRNKISVPDGIYHCQLQKLNLNFNQISFLPELNSSRLKCLETLELRGNHLPSTLHLCLPSLNRLYLAQNSITSLPDLAELAKLTFLHLRDNQIRKLDGFSSRNVSLEYLNLRNNRIADINEVRKLSCLPALKRLILLGNEINITDDENYPIHILTLVPSIVNLNKTTFTFRDREEAARLRRREEREKRRKIREDEKMTMDLPPTNLGGEDEQRHWLAVNEQGSANEDLDVDAEEEEEEYME